MTKALRQYPMVMAGLALITLSGALAAQDKSGTRRSDPPARRTPAVESATASARSAADYLNQVRADPGASSGEIGADLSGVQPRHALEWSETLAQVAQQKAQDMANRDYFAHVDPDGRGINIFIHQAGYELIPEFRSSPDQNNFESLGAGYRDAMELIRGLIRDENTPGLGHRIHLLGMNDFWADCTDIGIGHASNPGSQYGDYWVVIIAKHSFTGNAPPTTREPQPDPPRRQRKQ